MHQPGSQLKVAINYARNLKDTETFGNMDPYVKVILGTREVRTKEKTDAGTNPKFNEELTLEYQNEDEVDLQVWDGEAVGSDEYVGEARVNLQAVANNGGSWAGDLQLYRIGKLPAGTLNVRLTLVQAAGFAAPKPDRSPGGPGLYPTASPPPMNPNYQQGAPGMNPDYQATQAPMNPNYQATAASCGINDQSIPSMNPNYQQGQPPPNLTYQQGPPMNSVYAQAYPQQYQQPVYAQRMVTQAAVVGQPQVFATPVMAQPQVVYAQPQAVYPQIMVTQPQVVYRPPGPTGYVYRQF